MDIAEYNYILPRELIAKYPPKERGQAKLLVLDRQTNKIQDERYNNIEQFFCPGDVIVFNNTKVLKARLVAKDSNQNERELLFLEKHQEDNSWFKHDFLCRGRVKVGENLSIGKYQVLVNQIKSEGVVTLVSKVSFLRIIEDYGEMPIPPYLKRKTEAIDDKRYQTILAKTAGSVAAPTASLNMTKEIIDRLKKKGVKVCYLTLHVGLGTFLPIREDNIENHKMHKEFFRIPKKTIEAILEAKKNHKRVFAIGTTVVRALEYSAGTIYNNLQGDISGEADIFIYPDYKFRLVDGLLTNYHAPRSTVLMLTAAFAGWDQLKLAYDYAVGENYRFLSYGDSMLII